MTPVQSRLLAFLRQRALSGDVTPSFAEMASHLGVKSKSNICRVLDALEAEGKITRRRGRERAITVLGLSEFELGRIEGYRQGYAAAKAERVAA